MEQPPVIDCWNCGNPFALEQKHKESGHVFIVCASCFAPHDLNDSEGLAIMEDGTDAQKEYAKEWRDFLERKNHGTTD